MFKANPLYIIPARGGSKGIPRKNIRLLGGRPLLAYAVENARMLCSDIRKIIVSTDDAEIAEAARREGVYTDYMRPAELATDTSGSREVILDAMDWADSKAIEYNCVVLLQPTSPFRTVEDISRAIALYSPQIDMVVSVCESASNPYFNMFEVNASTGFLHVSKGNGLITRRQDAPKVWEYNGAVYVINPDSIRQMALGEFPRRVPCLMPRERSIDLDTLEDWERAEQLIRRWNI